MSVSESNTLTASGSFENTTFESVDEVGLFKLHRHLDSHRKLAVGCSDAIGERLEVFDKSRFICGRHSGFDLATARYE